MYIASLKNGKVEKSRFHCGYSIPMVEIDCCKMVFIQSMHGWIKPGLQMIFYRIVNANHAWNEDLTSIMGKVVIPCGYFHFNPYNGIAAFFSQ